MRGTQITAEVRDAVKERLSMAMKELPVPSADRVIDVAFPDVEAATVLLTFLGESARRLKHRRDDAVRGQFGKSVLQVSSRGQSLSAAIADALVNCARAHGPVLLLADAPAPASIPEELHETDLLRFGPGGAPILLARPGKELSDKLDNMAGAINAVLADPVVEALERSAPGLLLDLGLEILDAVRIAEAAGPEAPVHPLPEPVTPSFGLLSKQYREPPFDDERKRKILAHTIQALGLQFRTNEPEEANAFLANEMLVWFRTLGFLKDARFQQALAPYRDDKILRARLWRLHTLCWAAHTCTRLEGDFVDFGTYDGRSMDVVMRFLPGYGRGRRWWLFDLFDNPPDEARKRDHGPELRDAVASHFSDRPWVRVVGGALPGTFLDDGPERIAFMHLDLNDADAERACVVETFDRIVPGGMLVLDDFGSQRYAESHRVHREFFDAREIAVLELPTGQGLIVKP